MAAGLMIGVESSPEGTHAVLLDGERIVATASHMQPSADPGLIAAVLLDLVSQAPEAAQARGVAIATGRFDVAVQDRVALARIACVRLQATAEDVVPALSGWPPELLGAVGGVTRVLRGGCGYDGTPLGAPTTDELDALALNLLAQQVEAIAVTAEFAPVDPSAEMDLGTGLAARLPGVPVALSHSLGSIGLIERENATALNAALLPLAARLTAELEHEVSQVLPGVRAYLVRLDGTLMELPFAHRFPVFTLGCLEASRLRGLARLAGQRDCLVAGLRAGRRWLNVVRGGEPGASARGQVIAGVPTCLAGLDIVHVEAGELGWRLAGQMMGWLQASWVAAHSDDDLPAAAPEQAALAGAVGAASTRIAGLVDRIGPGRAGHRTADHQSAWDASGAGGAGTGGAGSGGAGTDGARGGGPGSVSSVADGAGGARASRTASEPDRRLATERAILAGALEGTIEITAVEEVPLAYVPGDLVRLRVVATGELP